MFFLDNLLGVIIRSFAPLIILAVIVFIIKKPISLKTSVIISAAFFVVLGILPWILTLEYMEINLSFGIICAALAYLISMARNKEERERAKDLEGLGGFIPVIAFVLAASITIFVLNYLFVWTTEVSEYSAFGVLVYVVSILFTLLNLAAFIALFKKLSCFRIFTTAVFILGIILNFTIAFSFEVDYTTMFVPTIINLILIGYLLTSCRVRNTFIYSWKGNIVRARPADEKAAAKNKDEAEE